jgi:DNA repair protein RadC
MNKFTLHDEQLALNPFEIRVIDPPRKHCKLTPMEFKVVMLRECPVSNLDVTNPEQVRHYYHQHILPGPYHEASVETLYVLCVNTRRRIIGHKLIATGTLDTLLVHPREVFKAAIVTAAAAVILLHNHPSGVIPQSVLCRMAHDLSDLAVGEPLPYAA